MKTWFFKIEGKSNFNSESEHPFGFFVNVIITTKDNKSNALQRIISDLKKEGFDIIKVLNSGYYKNFSWEEKKWQYVIDNMVKESINNPDTIYYSDFHTWEIK